MDDTSQIDWTGFFDDGKLVKFKEFHRDHPHILKHLVAAARELKEAGNSCCGMAELYNRLRWNHRVRTSDVPFKLNNNHQPFYTRLIDQTEPDLRGYITRRQAAADGEVLQ